MKKILVVLLAVFALTFVACGKEEGGLADKIKSLDKTDASSDSLDHGDKGKYLDIDRIVSEFDINEEDEKHIEFQDKDQEKPIFRIFIFEKMNSLDFRNPKKINILEDFYIDKDCDIIYKDESTIIIGLERNNSRAYNIHNFDNTKTELSIIVSIGSDKELSEADLLKFLDEAKSSIKK